MKSSATGVEFTDYLDRPVSVGDIIVYPSCQGSSAADLNQGEIVAIDEIIPHNPGDLKDRSGYMRKDRGKQYPPSRDIHGRWRMNIGTFPRNGGGDYLRDDSKAYMLRVKRTREGASGYRIGDPDRVVTVKNVDRVLVVTSLV